MEGVGIICSHLLLFLNFIGLSKGRKPSAVFFSFPFAILVRPLSLYSYTASGREAKISPQNLLTISTYSTPYLASALWRVCIWR